MTDPLYTPVVDSYSGFPVESRAHGPKAGSAEWLLDAVERHATAEQDALAQYEYLRNASDDPVIALVVQLILDDEARHHGLLKRIEATLRDAIEWSHSPAALPVTVHLQGPGTAKLVETATQLIKEEHSGAHYLRDLANRDRDASAGLQSVLIEMMAMDSEKHAHLLQFVHDRLAARSRNK